VATTNHNSHKAIPDLDTKLPVNQTTTTVTLIPLP